MGVRCRIELAGERRNSTLPISLRVETPEGAMRKKEINRIYTLIQAVEERTFEHTLAPRDVDDELREAKHQLHLALADLSSSDFRQQDARSIR